MEYDLDASAAARAGEESGYGVAERLLKLENSWLNI
ncbi:unnamed protein product [Amoebophrya sp. A25]|nr:unnamed protein product [Amoebophrya sp. A25]|eukprot:GSA25T00002925001.1